MSETAVKDIKGMVWRMERLTERIEHAAKDYHDNVVVLATVKVLVRAALRRSGTVDQVIEHVRAAWALLAPEIDDKGVA